MATPNASPSPIATRALPFREDCWSEEATATLVDAWGRRYMELNRGNLRQKDWQEVADTVNALHGNTPKTHRTDVQCKNRIDTLKKKYKVEKAKVVESNGGYRSSWGFFERLDGLIGVNYDKLQQVQQIQQREFSADLDSTPVGVPLTYRKMGLPPPVAAVVHSQTPPQMVGYRKVGLLSPQPAAVVRAETPPQMVGYRKMGLSPSPPLGETPPKMLNLPQKRGASEMAGSCFRRNYSAMAAAAAKPVMDEEEDEEEDDVEEEDVDAEENGEVEGVRKLAKAIERFGEVYERVEEMKQRQMVELEKQRMQFTKDLEVQRMQLFMDTQVQLEKIKRAKHSAGESGDGIEFDISEVFHQFNQFICNFM